MIRIIKHEKYSRQEKRYKVVDVAKAIGLTEGQVNGYFKRANISVKDGITLQQIEERLCGPVHENEGDGKHGVNWNDVAEIRTRLNEEYGIEVVEE